MNENSLKSLLNHLTKERLVHMARVHELPVSGERKPELVSLLAQRLGDPLAVHHLIAQLPAPAQSVFTRIRGAGGRVMSRSLVGELERDGLVHIGAGGKPARPTGRHHAPNGVATSEEALRPLLASGLLL